MRRRKGIGILFDVYKAISDGTRRKILDLLKDKDMTVGQITEHFNISQPSISQHLAILKNCGLIESSKDGKYIIYSLNLTIFQELLGWVIDFNNKKEHDEK
ncbi:autorepressor SdpR family transcription factor [Psychrobacillus sp. PGGUH221]|uniref:autorepressor SdpR family transcription factor n=1 Tax=Psychrobacillus sp. PGGUH221 TaxID=3020058 RepID=UPI0035C750A0